MLQIKNITKQYKTGDLVQNALNGVSLNFRDNEFVSILGPSGSGKTTLLNIIGGLDRYDSGDLIINNVSTKNYKDRDWDSYRNHTIGFVFQSYNLIPHQTVLANVELALTIGGVSKQERRERALDALEKVGLKEQAHKRPNQMSGGQMQRVAIARALVNDPDILLADEPTGALDTETSVQVMELLKEVAHDRLVIMVTHNPELAEEYSTRIVKLKDGKIIGDSDPFNPDTTNLLPPEHKNMGKASMSFLTALALSLNNLMTKKARTILTAFAGSIGIIGIALILSLSTGFQNYIDQIQEETLTSYPLSIYEETADITSALLSMVSEKGENKGTDVVQEQQYISTMFSNVGTNDLESLDKYVKEHEDEVDDMISLIQYQYSVKPLIYTINSKGDVTQLNPNTLLSSISGASSSMMYSSMPAAQMSSVFNEMLDSPETLEEQYDVLKGEWPNAYDEAVIVLSEPNEITDLLVYCLGLRDDAELEGMITDLMAGETVENENEPMELTYDDLMNLSFKVVDATDTYKYNKTYDLYEDMSEDQAYMRKVYEDALDLKIVGIVCPKEGENSMTLSPGVAYTKGLTQYVIEKASESEIVKKQMEDREVNVISGKRFDDETEEAGLDFQDMISVDTDMLSSAFGVNISEDDIAKMTKGYMGEISSSITADTTVAENAFNSTFITMATNMLSDYIDKNGETISMSDVDPVVNKYMKTSDCQKLLANLEAQYLIPQDTFATMYSQMLKGMLQGYVGAMAGNPGGAGTIPGAGTVPGTDADSDENTDESADESTDIGEDAGSDESSADVDTGTGSGTDAGEGTGSGETSTDITAPITKELVATMVPQLASQEGVKSASKEIAKVMTEAVMQKEILTEVGGLTTELMQSMASAFNVDPSAIAGAFQFDMSEEEISRLMEAMTSASVEKNADTNLTTLGYQDVNKPTSISFYFKDFDSKELFIDFLEDYNEKMEKEDEEKVIQYTDITGILMSSVSTVVDSVTYVLIAFVSISLIVSSIMIGIITYISVLERTKEIGVLRAIGASKKNISSIFNAETFIVGLCSGLLGVGVTAALVPPINYVIHSLTNNYDINAVLPVQAAIVLIALSIILTLISGLIPSGQAAKRDPVLALRSE
ncbi:MAG: ATP-binding cassette domain-containing protein [Dorea sp.]